MGSLDLTNYKKASCWLLPCCIMSLVYCLTSLSYSNSNYQSSLISSSIIILVCSISFLVFCKSLQSQLLCMASDKAGLTVTLTLKSLNISWVVYKALFIGELQISSIISYWSRILFLASAHYSTPKEVMLQSMYFRIWIDWDSSLELQALLNSDCPWRMR